MSTNQHQNNNEQQNVVLNMQSKDREDQQVALNNKKSVIGSDSGCNVVMAAQSVKPVHCMVIQGEAGTIVRNFCSDTRLNGNPVGDTWFQANDTLSIGGVNLRFDQQTTPRAADSAEIEDRSEEIIELVDRLSQLENQLGELKASNEEFERRAYDVENQLSQKLTEVSNLEDQNHQLTVQLGSIQRDLSSTADQDAAKEKAAELESALESKNEIIEQFAERNCDLAREVNELRDQVIKNQNLQSTPAHAPEQASSESSVEPASDEVASVDHNAEQTEFHNTTNSSHDETAGDTTGIENTSATDETFVAETESTDSLVEETAFEFDSQQTDPTDESNADHSFEYSFESQNEVEAELQNVTTEETQAAEEPTIAEEVEPTDSTDVTAETVTDDSSDDSTLAGEIVDEHTEDLVFDFGDEQSPASAETFENAPLEATEGSTTPVESEEHGTPEYVEDTPFVRADEATAEDNSPSPAPFDPFKVLELIDNARTNEIERLDADVEATTETPFLADEPASENVEPEKSIVEPNTARNHADEEQDDNADSWEASFRKEFRDELANKAASFCPDKNEVDEEKREEIASNIAQVESDLADLFRPKEEDESASTAEGIQAGDNDTSQETADTPVKSELADNESPQTEDTQLTSPTSDESEATSEETGEIEFNFDLAESNLAGAFSDLSYDQEGHDSSYENTEEIALDYTESSDPVVDDEVSEMNTESSEAISSEWESDVSEATEDTPSSGGSDGEETSADASCDEFSQEQADDFFQAAMEAENANPYASFLNESEDDADEETDADQSSTLSRLEALGFKFDEETEAATEKETESSEEETGSFSELYSQEQEEETESNSSGLSTAHLYQGIEGDEDSDQEVEQNAEPSQPLQPLEESAANPRSGDDETDDSYIQEYMKRLLGSDEEVASEAAPTKVEEDKPQAPSLLEKTFEREIKERQEMLKPSEFIPKTSAPEKSSNLQAMRDLANQSARSAIETSTRKRKLEQQSTLILVLAGICFFVGASLAMLSASPLSLTGMGSVLFFALTGIGAWYYFDLKNSQSKSPNVEENKAEAPQTVDTAKAPTQETES